MQRDGRGLQVNTKIAMAGGYSLATKGAKDVIDNARPLILEAVAAMDLARQTAPFTICDFGCADGGTSLETLAETVGAVRARAPDRPVHIVYCDQPFNDYNALFTTVQGRAGVPSPLAGLPGVYVCATATSFYEPVLPPGTLDLGVSFTAMHWLSSKPCEITGHVQAVGASGAELDAFAARGMADWETILLRRAAELRPGGRLVTVNFCVDEAGRYLGHTGGVNMFDQFNAIWREFLAGGAISEAEYAAITLPQYYKTLDEYRRPLTDPDSQVYRAGLRLVSAHTAIVKCPYRAAFERHGDAARFAKEYIPTLRSWTESTFFSGLDAGRPEAERRGLIDRYYRTYEDIVAADPAGHAMDYVHAYLVMERTPAP